MRFVFDDGGRKAAGWPDRAGDCVCRAICIATGKPYKEVWNRLADGNATQRMTKKSSRRKSAGKRNANYGIQTKRKWFNDYMVELGFKWVPTMGIGTGCRVHLRDGELPMGRLVVNVSKHLTAVIDGVVHDTYDPSRDETRCVYGYWRIG